MKSLGSSLPPMPPPGGSSASKKRKGPPGRRKDYSLLQWSDYFTSSQDVKVDDDNIFRIYERGSEGPLVFLIHGGGFSGLTWAVLCATLTKLVKCRTVAMDVRGHGNTKTTDEDDLSADRLASDIGNIISTLYKDTEVPPTILVGHSMGGAISVHSAIKNLVPSLVGMIVIDVVEGTALEALHSMQSFLKGRPSHFKSIEYAIEWVNRTGQIRNLESARVSMIGQLREMEEHEVPQSIKEREIPDAANTIAEEDEEDGETSSESNAKAISKEKPNQYYTWRIDLSKTESFWKGWFQGMSSLFLSVPVPKMLLLAGVDRLDKDLAVGQMQGKFQMQIIGNCGHTMHEDQPQKVAEAIATFLLRHKMAESLSGFERPFPCC